MDLKAKTVTTLAGNGTQAHLPARPGEWEPTAKRTELNSPWDVAHVDGGRVLYLAMAWAASDLGITT